MTGNRGPSGSTNPDKSRTFTIKFTPDLWSVSSTTPWAGVIAGRLERSPVRAKVVVLLHSTLPTPSSCAWGYQVFRESSGKVWPGKLVLVSGRRRVRAARRLPCQDRDIDHLVHLGLHSSGPYPPTNHPLTTEICRSSLGRNHQSDPYTLTKRLHGSYRIWQRAQS